MNEIDIRNYAGLMKELGLTGLEITEDNKVVRLERSVHTNVSESIQAATPPVLEKVQSTDYFSVYSPIVGVFYAASAENADPFVSPGDRVEKGKILCIIEAMKLMNEIYADESGVVTDICVTNGQVVEYGTELFRIRR